MHILESKKERKKALLKKNRLHEEIFQFMRLKRVEEKRVKDLAEKQKPKGVEKPSAEVGDKVARIRNRLTDHRRISKERWNRFAGTSGGGGRGL